MDAHRQEPETDERVELEPDADAWEFPQSPLVLAAPPHVHWPKQDTRFEEGLGGMGGRAAPAE
jgi:hypothetical protein